MLYSSHSPPKQSFPFSHFAWGCQHMAVVKQCDSFPWTWLMGRHGRTVGWGFLGSPEPGASRSPAPQGSQGTQQGTGAPHQAEGPFSRKIGCWGRGRQPCCPPWACHCQGQPQKEILTANHLYPSKDQKNQAPSIALKQNTDLACGCFVPFRKHFLQG